MRLDKVEKETEQTQQEWPYIGYNTKSGSSEFPAIWIIVFLKHSEYFWFYWILYRTLRNSMLEEEVSHQVSDGLKE